MSQGSRYRRGNDDGRSLSHIGGKFKCLLCGLPLMDTPHPAGYIGGMTQAERIPTTSRGRFPWGIVLDIFDYDFDGQKLTVVKYHQWVLNETPRRADESQPLYHSEELRASYRSLDALLIAWIAHRRLGLNQHMLVSGLCRALEIGE